MSDLVEIHPEYVYMTIPREYICVYHRILAMLADYGDDMLKDCKASCTDRNSGIIECFNMFNAAVAQRHYEKLNEVTDEANRYKKSDLIIKYIKAKINQIYKSIDNSTEFVFPIDENGELKAYVSCNAETHLWINPKDMTLYQHKYGTGIEQHFKLGPEDIAPATVLSDNITTFDKPSNNEGLYVVLKASYDKNEDTMSPCFAVAVYNDGELLPSTEYTYTKYFDNIEVTTDFAIPFSSTGKHNFKVVVNYQGTIKIKSVDLSYNDKSTTITNTKKIKSNENIVRYIHRKAIRPTVNSKELYYTNRITLLPGTYTFSGQLFDLINKIFEILYYHEFGTPTVTKDNETNTIKVEDVPVSILLQHRTYIRCDNNYFWIEPEEGRNNYSDFKLKAPTYGDIKEAINFAIANKDKPDAILTKYQIQKSRPKCTISQANNKRVIKTYRWCSASFRGMISNKMSIFRIRRYSYVGHRSDWVYVKCVNNNGDYFVDIIKD